MKVLALRHVPFEDLGAWGPALAQRGFDIAYAEAGVTALVDPIAPDLLVVGGGPIGVYDADAYPFLTDEIAFIRARIERNLPTIGLCLGAQLLAAAAGARVYPAGFAEIGILPITLSEPGRASCLAPFEDEPLTLHWHGDTFDLPDGAVVLASSTLTKHQAFALGPKIIGFQFHPEWGADPLESWLIGHSGNLRRNKIDVPAFRQTAERERPRLAAKAARVIALYLSSAGLV